MKKLAIVIGALGVAALLSTAAQAGTINFSDYANTFLSSAQGVSFSLDPGYVVNGDGTTPYVNVFGVPEIGNGANFGAYPSSDTLTFTFPRLQPPMFPSSSTTRGFHPLVAARASMTPMTLRTL